MTERKTVQGKTLYTLRGAFNGLCDDITWYESEIDSLRSLKLSYTDADSVSVSINNKEYKVSQVSLRVLCDEAIKQLSDDVEEKYKALEKLVEVK